MPRPPTLFFWCPWDRGEHGITWLATSESGKACVIKFLASNKRRAVLLDHRHFEKEAARWRDIWGAKNARAIALVDKSALVMPYIKTCEGRVTQQDANTKQLAKKGIDQMLDRGYVHRDLRWQHVGFAGTCPRTRRWRCSLTWVMLGNSQGVIRKQGKTEEEMLPALEL